MVPEKLAAKVHARRVRNRYLISGMVVPVSGADFWLVCHAHNIETLLLSSFVNVFTFYLHFVCYNAY